MSKSTYHVANAAIMPRPGRYEMKKISAEEFFQFIVDNAPRLISHIGYPANIELIRRETRPRVELGLLRAKDQIPVIHDGDLILIMRLQRVESIPKTLQAYHFDYFIAEYSEIF